MPPETPKVDSKNVFIGVAGLVIGLMIGVLIGRNLVGGRATQVSAPESSGTTNDLIVSQSATGQGKVVAVNNQKITIEGTDSKRSDFPVSPSVNVYIYKDKVSAATVSNDLTSVEVGKQVLINMGMQNGQYLVTTITVLP